MSTKTQRAKARYSNIIDSAASHSSSSHSQNGSSDSQTNLIPLDKILDRSTDTRAYDDQEISSLAMSMKHVGLIEPLVLDEHKRLLCGGRRRAAIRMLRDSSEEELNEAYKTHFPNDLVPCRVYPIDAGKEPEKALEIEVIENTHRRKYTADEVKRAAQRFIDAGYVNAVGRVPKGKEGKRLKPALAEIFGLSVKHIDRLLSEGLGDSPQEPRTQKVTSPKKVMQITYQKIHQKKNWESIESDPKLKKKYNQAQRLLGEISAALDVDV